MASRFIMPFANVGSGIKGPEGALLYFFETGTDVPKKTYTDSAVSIANTNPVVADSNGLFSDIWLSGTYRVVLQNRLTSQQWTADPVTETGAGGGSSTGFVFDEETIQLTSEQVNVVFITILANEGAFYVGSQGVDRGRLIKNVDYVVTGSREITLTSSYPANTYITGLSSEPTGGTEAILKESRSTEPYKRSLVHEVAFADPTYLQLVATYGYSQIYPQGIAVDETANEFIISRGPAGGSNNWQWFFVYSLATGVFKTAFTAQVQTWESIVIRYEGSIRWLYALNRGNDNVYRMNLTTLPANLSTISVADTYGVNANTQMTYDGIFFYVSQKNNVYKGTGHRNIFNVYDVAFTKIGVVEFPIEATGSFGDNQPNLAKSQGITFHDGGFVIAAGRIYKDSTDVSEAQYAQGFSELTANGNLVGQYFSRPDLFKARFETMVGHACTLIENEGIYSTNGNLYACWPTLDVPEWTDPAFAGKGIAITKEKSREGNRIDFSDTQVGFKMPFNSIHFQSTIHFSATSLQYPLRNIDLTNLILIVDMMRDNNLSNYSFLGDNQALTDLAGATVPTANNLIQCKSLDGDKIVISVTGPLISREYWITLGSPNVQVIKNITFT
jgi:hypothetical protein